jgi:hypothetical protein
MTDTAFQADAFQVDAFQIGDGGGGGGGGSTPAAGDGYTYIPNSRSAKKIRKLLERAGEPLAQEFEAKAPVEQAAPAELEWPEGYRIRQPRILPPKPENKLKWWSDAQAEPLPKQDSFEWWDKSAPPQPQWNASRKSKFEWWKT